MFMVHLIKSIVEKKEVSHFYTYIYIALDLALFLLIVIIVQNHSRFPPIGYKIVVVVIAIFLLSPSRVVEIEEFNKF
jgi:hypothetical protein